MFALWWGWTPSGSMPETKASGSFFCASAADPATGGATPLLLFGRALLWPTAHALALVAAAAKLSGRRLRAAFAPAPPTQPCSPHPSGAREVAAGGGGGKRPAACLPALSARKPRRARTWPAAAAQRFSPPPLPGWPFP